MKRISILLTLLFALPAFSQKSDAVKEKLIFTNGDSLMGTVTPIDDGHVRVTKADGSSTVVLTSMIKRKDNKPIVKTANIDLRFQSIERESQISKGCIVAGGAALLVSGTLLLLNATATAPSVSRLNSAISTNASETNALNSRLSSGQIMQAQYDAEKKNIDSKMTSSINKYNSDVDSFNAKTKSRSVAQGVFTVLSGVFLSVGVAFTF